jgi:hypothetical protein
MSKISLEDLVSSADAEPEKWLNEFMNRKNVSKSDLNVLSVSAQVLVTELFEEIELLSNQAISIALPNVRDALGSMERELACVKAESAGSVEETLESAKLSQLLKTASDLERAKINIQSVQSRLSMFS